MLTEGCDGVGGAQLPAPSPVTPDPVPSPVPTPRSAPYPAPPPFPPRSALPPQNPNPTPQKYHLGPATSPLEKKKSTPKPLKIAPYEGGGALRSGRPRAHTVNARPRPSRRRLAPRGGPAAISPSPPGWERAEGDEAQPLRAVFPGGALAHPPRNRPQPWGAGAGELGFCPSSWPGSSSRGRARKGRRYGVGGGPPQHGGPRGWWCGVAESSGGEASCAPGVWSGAGSGRTEAEPPPRQSPPPRDSASCQLPK